MERDRVEITVPFDKENSKILTGNIGLMDRALSQTQDGTKQDESQIRPVKKLLFE